MDKAQTICLCMIVKDEAKIIERALRSTLGFIDSWSIVDTGSKDNTPQLIESFFAEHAVSGTLHHRPWQDFASNRTEAFSLAQPSADYLLVLDADTALVVLDPSVKQHLKLDGYLIRYTGQFDTHHLRLLSTAAPWTYTGQTHEELKIQGERPAEIAYCDGLAFIDYNDGSRHAIKLQDDIRILSQELKHGPENPRTVFYLGNAYFVLAQETEDSTATNKLLNNALTIYQKRITMGGDPEEIYIALLQSAIARTNLGATHWDSMGHYIKAFLYRPQRLEALFLLLQNCRQVGAIPLGFQLGVMALDNDYPASDGLSVERTIHVDLFWKELLFFAEAMNEPTVVTHIMQKQDELKQSLHYKLAQNATNS